MENIKGRTQYLISKRRENIEIFEQILAGKCIKYEKYMKDDTFIYDVNRKLKLEKELLTELLKDKHTWSNNIGDLTMGKLLDCTGKDLNIGSIIQDELDLKYKVIEENKILYAKSLFNDSGCGKYELNQKRIDCNKFKLIVQ